MKKFLNRIIDKIKPLIKKLISNKKIFVLSVAGFVLAVALLVVGISFLVPKSFNGVWELTVNPELTETTTSTDTTDGTDVNKEQEKVYYVFEKPDRYGKGEWYICYEGSIEYYEYQMIDDDGVKKINLGSEDLEFKIRGSKLLGNAKITLIYPEVVNQSTGETTPEQEYVLEQARMKKYEKDSYKKFDVDKALVGEWASNERVLSYFHYSWAYTQTVNFNDNGIMTIHYENESMDIDRYIYYAYTAKDNQLTFSLVTDKETEYTVSYEFDENGNLKFIDDTTQDSVFSDSFFGDYTYYTSENLPEATEPPTDDSYYTEDSSTEDKADASESE